MLVELHVVDGGAELLGELDARPLRIAARVGAARSPVAAAARRREEQEPGRFGPPQRTAELLLLVHFDDLRRRAVAQARRGA